VCVFCVRQTPSPFLTHTPLHLYTYLPIYLSTYTETKKKGGWANLGALLPKVDAIFQAQSYFALSAGGAVTSWQVGCIRTNCMDNLDRTNVVQSLFARRSVLKQLGKLGSGPNSSASGDALNSPYKAFEKIYKSVWANNANSISQMYAGTGALKVDFTKTGKRTLVGLFNDGMSSCWRYYHNNFTDGVKQDSIDMLLGRYKPSRRGSSPFLGDPNHEAFHVGFFKVATGAFFVFLLRLLLSSDAQCCTINQLRNMLLEALAVSAVLLMALLFVLVKKGSSLGRRFVVRNSLVPPV